MTADAAGFRPRDNGRLFRMAMLLGHYNLRAELPLTVAVWSGIMLSWWLPSGTVLAGAATAAVFALAAIAMAMLAFQDFVHDRNLCLRDVRDAPLLDPQGAVTRNLRYLEARHDQRKQNILRVISLLPILAMLMASSTLSIPVKIAVTVAALVGIVVLAYLTHVGIVHRRLQAWCPWCHPRRGDGDEVVAPTPDPAGTGQR